MRNFTVLICLTLLGGFAAQLQASSVIMVNNASFENAPTGGLNDYMQGAGSYSVGGIPGWTETGSGAAGEWQPTPNMFNSIPTGSTIGYINAGTLTQNVGTVMQGYTYTLTVDIGTRSDAPDLSTATADIMVNGVTYQAIGSQTGKGNWSVYTATFTALPNVAGDSVYIQLVYNGDYQGDFDNVQLTAATPEPGSLSLLGAGLACFLISRRFVSRRSARAS